MSQISPLFDETVWISVDGFESEDITYHRHRNDGTVRIAFNRPEVRNAFRPQTVDALQKLELAAGVDIEIKL